VIFTSSIRTSIPTRIKSAKLISPILFLLLAVVLSSTALVAQQLIPNGTIIPVRLNSTLDSRKAKPGQVFTARVMQDVPLSDSKIRAGSKVIGHVVSAKRAGSGTDGQLSLRFDAVEVSKHRIPISANLRAIASPMEVEDAQVPAAGPDRGTSQAAWTTVQVGGEVVYRGGGPVANGLQVVGVPTANGVLAHLSSVPGTKCAVEADDNNRLQALWVFSSDACGAYGFSDLEITRFGGGDPIGEIVFTSHKRDVHLTSSSGMLLRVNNSGPDTTPHQ
jgi:hypothetical protein